MELTQIDLIVYGALLTILAMAVLIAVWGIRLRKELEQEGLELTVTEVRQRLGGQLLGPHFIWGVWQKLLSAKELRLILRDETGALVTEVTYFHLPLDGVLQRFTFDKRELHCTASGAFSGRRLLKDAATGEILLSCDNGTFRNTVYRGDSDEVLFTIKQGFVWGKSTCLVQNNKDIAVLLSLDQTSSYPPVLSRTQPDLPLLAQIFVYLCFPKG